ncbi:MAG: hypothetical protein AB1705_22215 [Verrucomicrobiota bacterium]
MPPLRGRGMEEVVSLLQLIVLVILALNTAHWRRRGGEWVADVPKTGIVCYVHYAWAGISLLCIAWSELGELPRFVSRGILWSWLGWWQIYSIGKREQGRRQLQVPGGNGG